MASKLPPDLICSMDLSSSARLGTDVEGAGDKSSDTRKLLWHPQPLTCDHPDVHRCVKQIKSVSRAHANSMPALACRMCLSSRVHWRRCPSQLELFGYGLCMRVFGNRFLYAPEFYPIPKCKLSVDLLIMSMHPSPRRLLCVQFDGRQHLTDARADVAFDELLLSSGACQQVVRLAQADRGSWMRVLVHAYTSAQRMCYSPSLRPHLVPAVEPGGLGEGDHRPSPLRASDHT